MNLLTTEFGCTCAAGSSLICLTQNNHADDWCSMLGLGSAQLVVRYFGRSITWLWSSPAFTHMLSGMGGVWPAQNSIVDPEGQDWPADYRIPTRPGPNEMLIREGGYSTWHSKQALGNLCTPLWNQGDCQTWCAMAQSPITSLSVWYLYWLLNK